MRETLISKILNHIPVIWVFKFYLLYRKKVDPQLDPCTVDSFFSWYSWFLWTEKRSFGRFYCLLNCEQSWSGGRNYWKHISIYMYPTRSFGAEKKNKVCIHLPNPENLIFSFWWCWNLSYFFLVAIWQWFIIFFMWACMCITISFAISKTLIQLNVSCFNFAKYLPQKFTLFWHISLNTIAFI